MSKMSDAARRSVGLRWGTVGGTPRPAAVADPHGGLAAVRRSYYSGV
jgi:hypothetical protein